MGELSLNMRLALSVMFCVMSIVMLLAKQYEVISPHFKWFWWFVLIVFLVYAFRCVFFLLRGRSNPGD